MDIIIELKRQIEGNFLVSMRSVETRVEEWKPGDCPNFCVNKNGTVPFRPETGFKDNPI
jgi:hypothetical protein